MGSKLAIILSFGFFIIAMFFSSDLICIQIINSELDALAIQVSHLISYYGVLNETVEDFATKDGKTYIVAISNVVQRGEPFEFILYREYEPLFMEPSPMRISIRRAAVVGYY